LVLLRSRCFNQVLHVTIESCRVSLCVFRAPLRGINAPVLEDLHHALSSFSVFAFECSKCVNGALFVDIDAMQRSLPTCSQCGCIRILCRRIQLSLLMCPLVSVPRPTQFLHSATGKAPSV
jgi:hypothetical protein